MSPNLRALIVGVSGQDGAYLAKVLLDKGYEVFGSSRDINSHSFNNLKKLNIATRINYISLMPSDFRSVLMGLKKCEPSEIYNLSGQTSVGLSFDQPVETIESIGIGTLNFLEAIKIFNPSIKYYNAGSSECFGDIGDESATESTPFSPLSPYAIAKVAAHNLVSVYRRGYGLFACTGILFNHESPLRPDHFVTKKIILGAQKIHEDKGGLLHLGNLEIFRDWGWAPEYVEAMWLMLQQDEPEDYVIATGQSYSLRQFVEIAFDYYSLNWREYVKEDATLFRPSDVRYSKANPLKAFEKLGWKSNLGVRQIIEKMSQGFDGTLHN